MPEQSRILDRMGRRSVIVRFIVTIHAMMAGTFAFILGRAAFEPSFQQRGPAWLSAGRLRSLSQNELSAVTLRVTRQDGYAQVVDRKIVYLVRTEDDAVFAMQSTCTHLGCQTSYDRAARCIICPCHGGQYDLEGNVVAGPPPTPLPRLTTRIEDGHVLVQV